MLDCFAAMTPRWFHRAFVYTGSVTDCARGLDFRYRYEQVKTDDGTVLKAATYSARCYECADDVEEQSFPWTEEGVAVLREWYQSQYERYAARKADN